MVFLLVNIFSFMERKQFLKGSLEVGVAFAAFPMWM